MSLFFLMTFPCTDAKPISDRLDGRYGMLVHLILHSAVHDYDVIIEGDNLPLEFYAADQEYCDVAPLFDHLGKESILGILCFFHGGYLGIN